MYGAVENGRNSETRQTAEETAMADGYSYMKAVYLASIFGGFALGIGIGNIGGILTNKWFLEYFHSPSAESLQVLAAMMQLGAIVGSLICGVGADRIGRRACCICSAMVLSLGCTVTLAPMLTKSSLTLMIVGRALIGVGVGAGFCCVPMYVSETAAADERGRAQVTFNICIAMGILSANVFNYAVLTKITTGWCLSLAMHLPFSVAFFLVMLSLPESPVWLQCHGKVFSNPVSSSGDSPSDFWDLCNQRCFIAMSIIVLGLLTGIDAFIVYAPSIFSNVLGGVSELDTLQYTVYVGITLVVTQPLAVLTVDRCGRRPLLLVGGLGMTSVLTVLSVVSNLSGTMKITLILAFVGLFGCSWGPLAMVVPSEIVHSRVRAKVLALGGILSWVADYLVVATYLTFSNAVGERCVFGVYAAINLGALIFAFCLVPEATGMKLDSDEDNSHQPFAQEARDVLDEESGQQPSTESKSSASQDPAGLVG